MRIAHGGGGIVAFAAVLSGAALLWAAIARGPVAISVAGVLLVLALWTLWFFRDPERDIAALDPELVLAPGQGKVMEVVEIEEPDHMGGLCQRISIFLSIFDVHVQRAPVAGRVAHRSAREGGFLAAWDARAGSTNARASLGIDSPAGPVLVRQITGLVARRILTYAPIGAELARGDRIGLIRFGSRVDLFVPLGWQILSKPGDRVEVGLTPMARMPARSETDADG